MPRKRKKQKRKIKLTPPMMFFAAFVIFTLTFAGIQIPDIIFDYLPFEQFGSLTEQKTDTSKQGTETVGENPGPKELGPATFQIKELQLPRGKTGWITYGKLDHLGRPTTANALITPNMINTGTSANSAIRPPGFISGLEPHFHARGHLIGRQLGGTGDELNNLVTLYQNPVNTPMMTKYENMIRQAVDQGDIVRYRVSPLYDDDQSMPIQIEMEAKGLTRDSTIDFHVIIYNQR